MSLAALSKLWSCRLLLPGITGSNPAPTGGMDVVSAVYYHVAVQRRPYVSVTECFRCYNNPLTYSE
jgi:hypothetical protein